MRKSAPALLFVSVILAAAGFFATSIAVNPTAPDPGNSHQTPQYTGSQSCRSCHEKFYKLWSTSHHGLAMQVYTDELARNELTAHAEEIVIGAHRYRAEIAADGGRVIEKGPEGEKSYPIKFVLGGKNVYYLLTPLDKGRLQTLPVAYDVRGKEWFDMAASGVRHFSDATEEAVNWKEWPYTFNTSCYGCHVSQLSTNYDPKSDVYRTAWTEPGINCETCHGPGEEHIRVCREAPKGQVPGDLKTVRGGKDFTHAQNNATCATCHAKTVQITTSFMPGDRYFDHYDLIGLESLDYYPDGRDLGENYTYSSWRMSPCAKSGQLDCLHCHTSSGRYKFKEEDKANNACMPCHAKLVGNAPAHTHHPEGSPGSKCVSCHMPMSEFARMRRSDHSMAPPSPSAAISFKSPNACNICHTDKDALWADKHARQWRARDYQAPVLHRASLIEAARGRDWTRLPEMLDYITSEKRDEIYAMSLLRLLRQCGDRGKWPVLLRAMDDPSPLVRAAAAESLTPPPSREALEALVKAASDDYRLVRVRAAAALAGVPKEDIKQSAPENVNKANEEYLASLMSRPDHWTSHYNLGNYYMSRGDPRRAISSFENATRFDSSVVFPLVNASIAYSRLGENANAEESLDKAFQVDPGSAAAHFNMGLLKAEQKDAAGAERHLRAALQTDPLMAEAAYNLAVLMAGNNLEEALKWCRRAGELRPDDPKYAYTLAFYMFQGGDEKGAAGVLLQLTERYPRYTDAVRLLYQIYRKQGKDKEAEGLLRKAGN